MKIELLEMTEQKKWPIIINHNEATPSIAEYLRKKAHYDRIKLYHGIYRISFNVEQVWSSYQSNAIDVWDYKDGVLGFEAQSFRGYHITILNDANHVFTALNQGNIKVENGVVTMIGEFKKTGSQITFVPQVNDATV